MDVRLNTLKTNFTNIITIRSTVKNISDTLQQRIDKLKGLYSELIRDNDNQMFIFGLDSFRFQSKLIDIEYEDMTRMFLAINNRMYCEYFKLYKIIVAYISDNITDKKILEVIKVSNFPVYKDLEPFKDYKFEIIQEIHENILILINSIVSNIESKETELFAYQKKRRIGLNIDNFVTSFNYDIVMMREKATLFLTYMEFFHQLHTKYLKRFSSKIQLMYSHIDKDIDFNDAIDMHKDKKDALSDVSEGHPESIDSDECNSIESDCDRVVNEEIHSAFDMIDSRCKTILTPVNDLAPVNDIVNTMKTAFNNETKTILGNTNVNNIVTVGGIIENKLTTANIENFTKSILTTSKGVNIEKTIFDRIAKPIDNMIPTIKSFVGPDKKSFVGPDIKSIVNPDKIMKPFVNPDKIVKPNVNPDKIVKPNVNPDKIVKPILKPTVNRVVPIDASNDNVSTNKSVVKIVEKFVENLHSEVGKNIVVEEPDDIKNIIKMQDNISIDINTDTLDIKITDNNETNNETNDNNETNIETNDNNEANKETNDNNETNKEANDNNETNKDHEIMAVSEEKSESTPVAEEYIAEPITIDNNPTVVAEEKSNSDVHIPESI